ncbi:MAG: adenylate/guanylate cyclase domain-containing protein [Chloroflexota bacterium]
MENATPHATQMSIINEIRHLEKTVDDLEGVLRQHQQLLRQKGMALPANFLADLQKLRTDLQTVGNTVEETQTEVQRFRALSDTAEMINSTLELGDVLNAVMDTVIRLTGAERGYLMLRNEQTKELEFRVARNIEQRTLDQGEFIVSSTIVGDVADSGVPVVTTNAAQDTRFSSQDSVVSFALRSILCVPLLLKGKVTGVIYADNRIRSGLFGNKELTLLYAFANQAAVAIENARLFEELRTSLAEITYNRDLIDSVFASIASGVITTAANDTVLTVNDAACHILNIALDLFKGQILWEALPTLYDELDQLVRAVREHEIEHTMEIEPFIPERGPVNLNLRFSPLRDGQQVTQGVAIVVDDLTELKQREAQLNVIRRYLPPAMVDNITSIDKLGLGGERRLITTLFIDVRGFATFPPSLKPPELMEMLNLYLTVASDAVTQQNGVIDKYMANEIMVLFNTQLNPGEDHAWRAVLSALNMANEFTAFYRLTGEPDGVKHFRAGIHTGVATLGNAGSETRKEFTAIGDAINLAHRLLENAQPGQIIISEDTYQRCETLFADPANGISVIPRDQIQVKGRKQSTKIYQVSREIALA